VSTAPDGPGVGFEAAVIRLLDSLEGEASFAADEFRTVALSLTRYLRATAGSLTEDEIIDVRDLALLVFIEAGRAGRVDRTQSPAGYLITIARTRARDQLSTARRHDVPLEELPEEIAGGTDPVLALDQILVGERIVELIRANRERGSHYLNALIAAWLDLSESGRRPTLRALAARLQVAPSTVSEWMAQLAALLADQS
jgi:DNA-directed RNA polymerase specialized sigma24 family protein